MFLENKFGKINDRLRIPLDNNKKYLRQVYHCGDYIYKEWFKQAPQQNLTYSKLIDRIELIRRVDSTYILGHGENTKVFWIKMRIIEGQSCCRYFDSISRKRDSFFVKKIVNFIMNHYESFYPIYHGDPALANIIMSEENTLHYIYYDNIQKNENKIQVLKHIESKCIEAFKKKKYVKIIKDLCQVKQQMILEHT